MTKVLVVGCGSIGRRHAANAARLGTVVVTDINSAQARETARSLGISSCDTLDQGLAATPDLVVIATPHVTHLPLARSAIEAGADVLVEKPFSNSLDGIPGFLAETVRLGRWVGVICNMRFHPGVVALRQALPRIGRPLFARAQYGNYLPDMRPGADYRKLYCARADAGGGVILDAIHEIDYLSWLFGPVHKVVAEAGRLDDLDIDVEDYAAILLTHAGGVRSEIHLDYVQRSKRRGCEIVGTGGTLVWTSEGRNPEHCLVRFRAPGNQDWETILNSPDLDTTAPYVEMMKRVVERRASDPDLLDARRGAESVAVALAARRSAVTGCAVQPEAIQ